MNLSDKIKYGAIGVLAALLLLAQWYYSSELESLQGQISLIKYEAQQAEIEALDRQREIEHEWQAKADQAAQSAAQGVADVHQRYDWAVSELDLDSLRTADPGRGETALPAITSVTGGAEQARACECPRPDTRDIKAALLTVARDCDITATRYNELLRLVTSYQ